MRYSLLLCLGLLVACRKEEVDPTDRYLNNKIDIIVYSSSGDSSMMSFRGKKAPMYIDVGGYAVTFVAEGKDSSGESTITFEEQPYYPGDTMVLCTYRPKGKPEYSSYYVPKPGVIKFTSYENNYAAGYFNAKCENDSDFVRITGTFSGGYND